MATKELTEYKFNGTYTHENGKYALVGKLYISQVGEISGSIQDEGPLHKGASLTAEGGVISFEGASHLEILLYNSGSRFVNSRISAEKLGNLIAGAYQGILAPAEKVTSEKNLGTKAYGNGVNAKSVLRECLVPVFNRNNYNFIVIELNK